MAPSHWAKELGSELSRNVIIGVFWLLVGGAFLAGAAAGIASRLNLPAYLTLAGILICGGMGLGGLVNGLRYLRFAFRMLKKSASRTPVAAAEAFLRASMPRVLRPSSSALAWNYMTPGMRETLGSSDAISATWAAYTATMHKGFGRARKIGFEFSPPTTAILAQSGHTGSLRANAKFQTIILGIVLGNDGEERTVELTRRDAELMLIEIGGFWYVDGYTGEPFQSLKTGDSTV